MEQHGKYIIVKTSAGCIIPILFSHLIDHNLFQAIWHKDSIISAGFFEIYSDPNDFNRHYARTYGESINLKIPSIPPNDDEIIQKFLEGK